MSPFAQERLWSLPLVVLALLMGMLGFAPSASAEDRPDHHVSLVYDCLEGQTLAVTPGQMRTVIRDENGTVIGEGMFINAALKVYPTEDTTNYRYQHEHSSSETSFHAELGLPLNEAKTVRLRYHAQDTGTHVEYDQSLWECEGEPADTDGDSVPDELDDCPDQPGTASNGCPDAGVLTVVHIEPAHTGSSDGEITFTVTNPDGDGGGPVAYTVSRADEVLHTTGALADGQTSPEFSATGAAGTRSYCAEGDDGSYNCINVTVPTDSTPAFSGKMTFAQTCSGLRTTVTNNGWKSPTFQIRNTTMHGAQINVISKRLAPGESLTLFTGRHYRATSQVRLWSTDDGHQAGLGSSRWSVPAGCQPMIGGTSLLKWSGLPANKIPKALVRTKAYRTSIGVQWKRGISPDWRSPASAGKRWVSLDKVPPRSKRCFRLWVRYFDGTDFYGTDVLTSWRCYTRRR